MDQHGHTRTDRPRVVVSVTSTADGRVALNRRHVLMDDEASSVWTSLHPPTAAGVEAARESELTRLYEPEVVLEGSGTFVPDNRRPARRPPAARGHVGGSLRRFSSGRCDRVGRDAHQPGLRKARRTRPRQGVIAAYDAGLVNRASRSAADHRDLGAT